MPPPNNLFDVRVKSGAEMRSENRPNDDDVSSSAQAQMLFAALRSMIIQLVQAAVPNCPNLHDVPLEFEARSLLAAFQKHVSCIIRDTSQLENQNAKTQTVNLEDLPSRKPSSQNLTKQGSSAFRERESSATPYGTLKPVPRSMSHFRPNEHQNVAGPHYTPFSRSAGTTREERRLNKALPRLRKHVFNDMPIRLLCFQKRNSKLDITLLDRAAIYSHLAPKLVDIVRLHYSQSSMAFQESAPVTDTTAYAILSHTWLRSTPGEVSYDDWRNLEGGFDLTHPGYQKLANFCSVALEKHGLTLGWMDTVCINKASSAELDESIRSMYKWYEKAKVCVTYLAETTSLSEMAEDAWFTRGWTLQELLAPKCITFYDNNWKAIAHYSREIPETDLETEGIRKQIELATTISPLELKDPDNVSISRKMQWAAEREVTREEDVAYSLMGIFNVNMSIAYGEGGQAAFIRLIKEILSSAQSDAGDIFNWGSSEDDESTISALLPSGPKAYLRRSTLKIWEHTLIEPLTLTHLGLRVPVLLLSASPTKILPSADFFTPIGDYYARVTDIPFIWYHISHSYNILDIQKTLATSMDSRVDPRMVAFGILNCGGDESSIHIPQDCFAIVITYDPSGNIATINPMVFGSYNQLQTEKPIVFSLRDRRAPQKLKHTIERTQLARHGMYLRNMYL